MDDLHRMHVNAETITMPLTTFRGATDTATRPIYEGVLLKRCSLCWRPRYVKLVLDPTSHISGRPSSELLIYDPHQRKSKLNRIRTDSIVTIRASRDCFFQIFLSDGKILQFRTDSVEKQICWMASVKSALGKGNVFHVQVNTQSNLEHALLYCIEVNLPAHREGQLDRILVLASPVNDINMFAWDLNRVLCFVESDVGIRMQLCRTCMGPQDTTITFMLSKQFIRPCLAFLCREARISEPPVSEHGAFVYNLNHVCGFSPPPAVPAPPPPQDPTAGKSPIPKTPPSPRNATTAARVPPGSGPSTSEIPPLPAKPLQPPSLPPPPSSASVGGVRHHPVLPPPLSLPEDSGTGGSSSYFYFSPKDSDAIGFFGPAVPPRTIPRKGYECGLPAVAQPYSNCNDWAWLPQPMYFEGPYQISSRVIITDTGTVVHEPNVLGNKSVAGGHAFGRPDMPLPPRRLQTQSTRHRTVEFQTAHTIAFGDPGAPPQVPNKSVRKSPSYPLPADTAKRSNQLVTCQEGQDEDDEYIVVPVMAPVMARKQKPPPPLPSTTEDSPEPMASGPLREEEEVVTTAHSSVKVAVAVDISHTTYSREQQSPRSPPREPPRTPPQEASHRVPSHLRKQKCCTNERHDGISCEPDAPPLPTKVDTRGDDQAGLLDFEKPLVAPKPIPKPRAFTRATELRTSVSVNVVSES